MPITIRVCCDPRPCTQVELDGKILTIGRARRNDLILPDGELRVASKQVEIVYRDGAYFARDFGLGDTPLLNDRQLPSDISAPLHRGDELTFGGYRLVFLELAPPIEEPPSAGKPHSLRSLPKPLEEVVRGFEVRSKSLEILPPEIEEETRRLVERIASGTLRPAAVWITACLGDPAARSTIPPENEEGTHWMRALARLGDPSVLLLAGVAAAWDLLRECRGVLNSRLRVAIQIADRWRRTRAAQEEIAAGQEALTLRNRRGVWTPVPPNCEAIEGVVTLLEGIRALGRSEEEWEPLLLRSIEHSALAAGRCAQSAMPGWNWSEACAWGDRFIRAAVREAVVPALLGQGKPWTLPSRGW